MTNKEKANVSYNMLNDIVEHFGNNPNRRCIDKNGICKYTPKSKCIEGNIGCAIGMYLDWDVAKKLDNLTSTSIYQILNNKEAKKLLPKWMQEIGKGNGENVLIYMQNLHDIHSNWIDIGLSSKGEYEVEQIKKLIKNTYKH